MRGCCMRAGLEEEIKLPVLTSDTRAGTGQCRILFLAAGLAGDASLIGRFNLTRMVVYLLIGKDFRDTELLEHASEVSNRGGARLHGHRLRCSVPRKHVHGFRAGGVLSALHARVVDQPGKNLPDGFQPRLSFHSDSFFPNLSRATGNPLCRGTDPVGQVSVPATAQPAPVRSHVRPSVP